jgi:hypothetical protein
VSALSQNLLNFPRSKFYGSCAACWADTRRFKRLFHRGQHIPPPCIKSGAEQWLLCASGCRHIEWKWALAAGCNFVLNADNVGKLFLNAEKTRVFGGIIYFGKRRSWCWGVLLLIIQRHFDSARILRRVKLVFYARRRDSHRWLPKAQKFHTKIFKSWWWHKRNQTIFKINKSKGRNKILLWK